MLDVCLLTTVAHPSMVVLEEPATGPASFCASVPEAPKLHLIVAQNDEGRAEIEFPGSAAHGFRDFRILDDDLTLTVGNRKSYVCVQPL